jgi:hypothetical protein
MTYTLITLKGCKPCDSLLENHKQLLDRHNVNIKYYTHLDVDKIPLVKVSEEMEVPGAPQLLKHSKHVALGEIPIVEYLNNL